MKENHIHPQVSAKYDAPEVMTPKIVRWTRRVGSVSPGLPNIPKGQLYYYGYQRAAGSRKHSGPSGRRAFRFYQAAYISTNVKKTKT